MKRQALGKGLSSLIPDKTGLTTLNPQPAGAPRGGEEAMPPMSAADIEKALKRQGSSIEMSAADMAGALAPAVPAVAPAPAAAAGSSALQWVDIDRIKPNPAQPRKNFQEDELEELAASIRSSGILQPVIVRRIEGGFGLVAGERRWRAAQRAGLHKIPALIREIPEDRLIEVALIENIQRQNLNPIEEARAFSTLIEDLALTQAEVAERVGRQRSTIANSLRLLALSPKVQALVEAGTLSAGHARTLASLPGHRAQELGAEIFVKRGFSVREAEAWASKHTGEEEPREVTPRKVDPNVRAAEEGLQKHLGTRVRIVQGRGRRGRIQIEYFSPEELDRIYDRLIKA
jgi:ParB family chromosome partitioning protein